MSVVKKVHVKKGDTVILRTGKAEYKFANKDGDRKTGKVIAVSPKEGKVIVEGFNMVTKHLKPQMMGQAGSVVSTEAPIYASKVQLVCPHCGKPTRVGHTVEDGKKLRVCKKCGKSFE
jgi:large subunit ribosomal protein L24